jgi:photosystem II stability/assembly factor-like uncharacterized protein
MDKNRLVPLILFLLVLGTSLNVYAQQLEWQDIGSGNMHFSAVWVSPDDRFVILAGSGNTVLKTENGGKSWRRVLFLRGQAGQVNFIAAGGNSRFLFAATNSGLYLSRDRGNNWNRVFRGKNYLENECTAVAVLNERVYLGTKGGLFLSRDNCRSWHKEPGSLADLAISTIAVGTGNVYVASAKGVFRTNLGTGEWSRIFISKLAENEEEPEETPLEESEEIEGHVSGICYLVSDCRKPGYVYLADSRGIYKSVDSGVSWEVLPDYGLFDKYVTSLSVSADSLLFAVTKKGIFVWRKDRWYEVSIGLLAGGIKDLSFDKQENLYVACDKGLFKGHADFYGEVTSNKAESLSFAGEPEIGEVQEAAIKYAEVEPEKIIQWRKQAAKKAFLPKVSTSVNRDTSDLWHWESGSSTKAYDDVLMRGKEVIGWDVTLSWDLGEIIWNEDQTNIDVRSRLMVELRDDILDEVIKVYFERMRVRAELDNLAIEDKRKRFEKELRLRELTAMLDGLTGGYFSRSIKKPKA